MFYTNDTKIIAENRKKMDTTRNKPKCINIDH